MGVWKLGIGVVALVALAAVTVGIVGAQTDEDGSGPLGNFVSRLAENLGITEAELDAALDETQLGFVEEALAEGQITEEQAAERREAIESGESFFGQRGHKMQGGHQMRGGLAHGADVAEFIGIEQDALREAIEGGQSLVQVAVANGVSEQALTDFLLGEIEAKLAEAVASGRIDQAKADEVLAGAGEKIAECINREGPPDHGGRMGGEGRFQGSFRNGETPDVTEAVSPTF
jgi:hypothetical protein